ncbi:MAG: hypothetical protein R3A79_17340 [Nannocystaceae bacterium]
MRAPPRPRPSSFAHPLVRLVSLFGLVSLAACAGGETESASAASAGSSSSSTSASDSDSATSTSSGSGPATDSGAGTDSGATEGTTSTTGTTGTTGATSTTSGDTTGATSSTDTTSSTGDTTGDVVDLCAPAVEGDACESDADCAIAGDCCSCVAYNPSMTSPGNCGGNCKQDRCSEWGLEAAACEAGVCVVKGKSCNQDKVDCDALQPECPDGQLPQVAGGCYTGACLPLAACDWVPGCEYCGANICAITEGPDCVHHRCVAPIPECDGLPYCECLGEIFCNPPHESCSEEQGALICAL